MKSLNDRRLAIGKKQSAQPAKIGNRSQPPKFRLKGWNERKASREGKINKSNLVLTHIG